MKTISEFFKYEERKMLYEVERLHKILTHLCYEGKVSHGKNVKAAQKAVRALGQLARRHQSLQERVVFPFLIQHIPRHEVSVHFLRTDHKDIQRSKQKLEASLRVFSKRGDERVKIEKIQEAGVYLICLLQHHMELECKSIHSAIRKELRRDEKIEVKEKINKWLIRNHNGIGKI